MQKCYLQKVHLHGLMTINEYFVHWHQQNNYLALFPPHGRVAQKMRDDKIIELIYKQLPNHMKSDLKQMNNFDINNMDMMWFCEVLKCLELSYQLEKKMEKSKKLETLKKDLENLIVSILERSMPTLLTNHHLSLPRSHVCFMVLTLT